MRRFAAIDLIIDYIPDGITTLSFRHLLEKHELCEQIFEIAEIPALTSSTKNKEGKRDPEMYQTRKGNQWYFGIKVHIGDEKDSELIH